VTSAGRWPIFAPRGAKTGKIQPVTAASLVHPDKIRAYMETDYSVAWDGSLFVLRIDRASDRLRALYAQTGAASALFITAFNPEGRLASDGANAEAHRRLREDLAALRIAFAEGEGVGTDTEESWPAEKSFLALGVDKARAEELGRRYGQDAVVWADADGVPRLLLLR
jgi:hypothetical protein